MTVKIKLAGVTVEVSLKKTELHKQTKISPPGFVIISGGGVICELSGGYHKNEYHVSNIYKRDVSSPRRFSDKWKVVNL